MTDQYSSEVFTTVMLVYLTVSPLGDTSGVYYKNIYFKTQLIDQSLYWNETLLYQLPYIENTQNKTYNLTAYNMPNFVKLNGTSLFFNAS